MLPVESVTGKRYWEALRGSVTGGDSDVCQLAYFHRELQNPFWSEKIEKHEVFHALED
jgi:hypothetical protein